MGKRGSRYFSAAVKLALIRRYTAGESACVLAEAYAIRATLVHHWVAVYRQHGEAGLRGPGRPNRAEMAAARLAGRDPPEETAPDSLPAAQRRIALLEKKVAQQALDIDFFKHALWHFETSPQPATRGGATALTRSSGRRRGDKAD